MNHESSETNVGVEVVQAVQTLALVIARGKPARPMIVSECGKETLNVEVLKATQQEGGIMAQWLRYRTHDRRMVSSRPDMVPDSRSEDGEFETWPRL